jgi:antitoxin ParD1/3/4
MWSRSVAVFAAPRRTDHPAGGCPGGDYPDPAPRYNHGFFLFTVPANAGWVERSARAAPPPVGSLRSTHPTTKPCLNNEKPLKVTLTPEQIAWIDVRIARGDFPSVEDAVRQLIDERIAERSIEDDDLAWAGPFLDSAIVEAERGNVMSLEEHRAHNRARLAPMRG